jgi:hypothetical protein
MALDPKDGLVSGYYDPDHIGAMVAEGRHRAAVGAKWEMLGTLQRDFLIGAGLKPDHYLIDIGCGAFRGGVKIVPYLDPGHYFGTDISQALIDAGYSREIEPAGLAERLPRANLACNGDFAFPWPVRFDVAIAQSLFTHLPFNLIRYCLARLAPHMAPGGVFYASYYPVPDTENPTRPRLNQGMPTFPARDPYHYRFRDLEYACVELPWRISAVPDAAWPHPQQKIVKYERLA